MCLSLTRVYFWTSGVAFFNLLTCAPIFEHFVKNDITK